MDLELFNSDTYFISQTRTEFNIYRSNSLVLLVSFESCQRGGVPKVSKVDWNFFRAALKIIELLNFSTVAPVSPCLRPPGKTQNVGLGF